MKEKIQNQRSYNRRKLAPRLLSKFLVKTHCDVYDGLRLRISDNLVKVRRSREIKIAELVAQGLTNAEIGTALLIQENSVK
jgi:DNA-binding NarL/FixJ family response regulator